MFLCIILHRRNGRSVGPYEIPTGLWKSVVAIGILFLSIMFNQIKNGSSMPQTFRESFLLPFFKHKGVINNLLMKIVPNIHSWPCGFVTGRSADADADCRCHLSHENICRKPLETFVWSLLIYRIPRDLIWIPHYVVVEYQCGMYKS